MKNKRYEVICFDGFAMWDTHDCRTREIARQEKIFHEGLRSVDAIKSINMPFANLPLQFPYVKIWDRQLHSWI